jgi:3'-5' exoribonuclease
MVNQKNIIELKKGDVIDHFFLVKKCELRTTKNNKSFLTLELSDKTGSIPANIWENFESFYNNINVGSVIKIEGVIDEYQGNPQIKISGFRLTKDPDKVSPADFLPVSRRNFNEMKKEFYDRIERIGNTSLKTLVANIFNKKNFENFSKAPAGKSWHHSYIHGLLEHTLEIIKICDLMCDIHPEINRDLLISGAMLHDFGKVEELSYDSAFEYTDKGKLLGHIVISAMVIDEETKKIPNFPEELKNLLIHIVLSHQGKLENASPIVPKTLEAITLYHTDELSAKVNAYKNALSNQMKTDSKWTRYLPLVLTELYKHDFSEGDFNPENKEDNISESLFE